MASAGPGESRIKAALCLAVAIPLGGLVLGGCVGAPGLRGPVANAPVATGVPPETVTAEASADPLVVEAAFAEAAPPVTLQEFAARPEPRSVADVEAIQAELAALAERRAAAGSAREIAALDARAEELKRLAAAQATPLRR